jgi:hypothetical protein
LVRALTVETHENGLKAHRCPNMKAGRGRKKERLRPAA